MDVTLARQAGVPLESMDTTLVAQALDGHLLGKISHRTIPISLTISGNHTEEIHFFIIHAPAAPLVLGRPWLNLHNASAVKLGVKGSMGQFGIAAICVKMLKDVSC